MLYNNQKQNTLNNRKNQALLEIRSIVEKRRGFVREIVRVFLRFRHAPFIKLSNERIAREVGCSTRTVKRWTNWLHDQGYITKSQENQFSVNDFTLCEQLVYDTKYEAYINSLPEKNIDFCINSIILPETVTPNSSIFIDNIIFKPIPVPVTRLTPARARVIDGDGYGKLTKRQREYRNRVGDALQMVQKEVREWIEAQKSNKLLPTILRDPRVGLISPAMQEIIAAMKLTEVDYLKMIAFDDGVLKAAWAMTKKVSALKNPIGFFLSACQDCARQQNFTPEWQWYYRVCEVLGIDTKVQVHEPDERPSDMYQRPVPSHAKPVAKVTAPKHLGVSQSTQKREGAQSLSGMAKLTMLHAERRKGLESLTKLEEIPVFGVLAATALRNKIEGITNEINQLEKELTRV